MGVSDTLGGIADTSVFIAREVGRPILEEAIPDVVAVSMVTVGELRLGILRAQPDEQSARMATLESALTIKPLAVDRAVADSWAELKRVLGLASRSMPVNDSWIAATALSRGVPVVTQDADYDVAAEVAGLEVIRV